MKPTFFMIILLMLGLSSSAQVDPNALGMRLSGNDDSESLAAEISFQKGLSGRNRVEFDLGWSSGSFVDLFRVAAFFHWVFPLDQGFAWYLGPGLGTGILDDDRPRFEEKSDVFIILGGQGGMQYSFKDLPLQLSLDLRPEFFAGKSNDELAIDLGLSIRYIFKN